MIDVSKARAVTLQFATESGLSSWAIRWFCHSDYSHIDFVLPDGRLLGARLDGGVAIRPEGYAAFSATRRIRVPTDKAPAIYRAALSQQGTRYDWKAIAAFALPDLMPRRNWRDPGAWFCSELGAWAFERGGFFAGHRIALPPDRVTPGDLLLLLSPFAVEDPPPAPRATTLTGPSERTAFFD